jgi:small-conductance mechanosensitive channel
MLNFLSQDQTSLILNIGFKAIVYTTLIFTYWLVFNNLSKILQLKIKNASLLSTLNILAALAAIALTITTITLAFIDNIAVFFGSLSLLSAAFVFALQDFVSCFFAWAYVEVTKQYRINDLIQIQAQNNIVSGWIEEIGLFRTQVRERVGGESLDRERPTGKTVTFPNNFIFKYALSNQTKNHLILWHNLDIIITFESDYELARNSLKIALEEKFEELLEHPEQYFQKGIGELRNFKPKIYNSIQGSGVGFSIWFGARAGFFREILEEYTNTILHTLKENNIELAYNTSRIVRAESI